MKVLFEFVILSGVLGTVVAYITFVRKKFKARGYRVEFVGGPLDREVKQLPLLLPEYRTLVGRDHRGNELVGIYDLDDLEVGVYTFREDSVRVKEKTRTTTLR